MSGNISPKGRFIYARYKTLERARERFDDMCCEGELSPCEGLIEPIRDHSGKVIHYAVTIE